MEATERNKYVFLTPQQKKEKCFLAHTHTRARKQTNRKWECRASKKQCSWRISAVAMQTEWFSPEFNTLLNTFTFYGNDNGFASFLFAIFSFVCGTRGMGYWLCGRALFKSHVEPSSWARLCFTAHSVNNVREKKIGKCLWMCRRAGGGGSLVAHFQWVAYLNIPYRDPKCHLRTLRNIPLNCCKFLCAIFVTQRSINRSGFRVATYVVANLWASHSWQRFSWFLSQRLLLLFRLLFLSVSPDYKPI